MSGTSRCYVEGCDTGRWSDQSETIFVIGKYPYAGDLLTGVVIHGAYVDNPIPDSQVHSAKSGVFGSQYFYLRDWIG